MSSDDTQFQSADRRKMSEQLSLHSATPPSDIPGYQLHRFLGSGAYGEVWVATDQNTGRQVAIKFFSHHQSIEWSHLSREVEKLVFLSADRYVVQLLDVGWKAKPPFYVMEFMENGSLETVIQEHHTLEVDNVCKIIQEVATGLQHAHNKGILHCDLKPANILLDTDFKPRLADFGQSRLSTEQIPALGTLFYMSPEQADLEAVPDVQWDVYALGALLYCMLTGSPPYKNQEIIDQLDSSVGLKDRLARYRKLLKNAPIPSKHRKQKGVDKQLIEIVDRCLSINPKKRYPHVQAVLDSLQARRLQQARRPLVLLGLAAPFLLLLPAFFFGWYSYHQTLKESEWAITEKEHSSNQWTARYAAKLVSNRLEETYRAVETLATNKRLVQEIQELINSEDFKRLSPQLQNPEKNNQLAAQRKELLENTFRQQLENTLQELCPQQTMPYVASWFICDQSGTMIAAYFDKVPESLPTGKNYSYRTYFHGRDKDYPLNALPEQPVAISQTHLSALFPSTATNTWKLAISTPVVHEGKVLGVVALTVEMGNFMQFEGEHDRFAILTDGREGPYRGIILEHPLFQKILSQEKKLPKRFSDYRVPLDEENELTSPVYLDPVGQDKLGKENYSKEWLAASTPVNISLGSRENGHTEAPTGLVVIVQKDYSQTIKTVHNLGADLLRSGFAALLIMLGVIVFAWWFAFMKWRGQGVFSLYLSTDSLDNSPSTYRLTGGKKPSIDSSPLEGNNDKTLVMKKGETLNNDS